MLDKLSGQWAPKPRPGPHAWRECLPLTLILRNRLRYAFTEREATYILKARNVTVDRKVRTESKFPVGFMDVIEIAKTADRFRLLFDTKGRQTLVPIDETETSRKLLKVQNIFYSPGRVPVATMHDGRVIRYPDPLLKKNDTIVYDLKTHTVTDWIRFKVGRLAFCTGGANRGRVGRITKIERHPGSFHVVHVKDATGAAFATRLTNVFVIGRDASLVTLPKAKGIRQPLVEDRLERIEKLRAVKDREVVGGARKTVRKGKSKSGRA